MHYSNVISSVISDMEKNGLEGYDNPAMNNGEMNGATVQNGHAGQSSVDLQEKKDGKKDEKKEEKEETVSVTSMVNSELSTTMYKNSSDITFPLVLHNYNDFFFMFFKICHCSFALPKGKMSSSFFVVSFALASMAVPCPV